VGEAGPPGRGSLRKSGKIMLDESSSTMMFSARDDKKKMLSEFLLPPTVGLTKKTSDR
jgi:hypothetical protein